MRIMKQAQQYLHFGCWVMDFSPLERRRAVELQHSSFCLACCPATLGTDASSPYRLEGLLGWRSSIALLEGLCSNDESILQTVQS